MATTVDHISGGRLEFGLGAAWHTYEHEAFAIPFHTVGERLSRLGGAGGGGQVLGAPGRAEVPGVGGGGANRCVGRPRGIAGPDFARGSRSGRDWSGLCNRDGAIILIGGSG